MKSLKKVPKQLPDMIWDPFLKYGIVRTVQQWRHDLLREAIDSTLAETQYSASLKHSLNAALALDASTQKLCVKFKSGANAELDLLLDGSNLLLNDKWLDFDRSHDGMPCWYSKLASLKDSTSQGFFCSHVVMDLYEMVLTELRHKGDTNESTLANSHGSLRRTVSENLHEMPSMIQIVQGERSGEIEVSWACLHGHLATRLGVDLKFRVTLHRESKCSAKRKDLLVPG